jgi:DHA2 family multidrug resistance protein-like MFS transporter
MDKVKDIGRSKWFALGAISLAAIAFSLDLTVLNLALPNISTALHATTSQLQWIVDSYALVLAALTLPAGLLGDRYGRKKFLLIALTLFGLASAACAFSTSVNLLISARVALGVGAAFILPLALSTIPVFFNDEERAKAVALVMGGVFLAYPLGPILGGFLLTHYWWGSVFLINVPIVLVALVVIAILLPESKGSVRHKIDVLGIILSVTGLTGITYGAIQAESKSWGSSEVIISLLLGIVLLTLFVFWEKRKMQHEQSPLVDLNIFRNAEFTWGTLLATLVTFCMFGLLFCLPQYLEDVQGKNALGAGYLLLPMVGGLVIGSVIATKVVKKLGAKIAAALGFVLIAVGLIIGTGTSLHATDSFIVLWVGIAGLGLGFVIPSAMNAALGALTPERSGVGSSLVTAIRQVGGTLGVAILGTLLGESYRSKLKLAGLPTKVAGAVRSSVTGGVNIAHKVASSPLLHTVRTSFVHGMAVLLWACAGIAIVSVVLALIFLPNKQAPAVDKN